MAYVFLGRLVRGRGSPGVPLRPLRHSHRPRAPASDLDGSTVTNFSDDLSRFDLSPLDAEASAAPVVVLDQQPSSPAAARTCLPVLHVVNGEHYAGAERVQDLLAARLFDYGYTVDFATLKAGRFAGQRQALGAALHTLAMRSRLDLRPALALARLMKAHGYRLIHTHTPRSVLVGRLAAALAGVPLVHHLHSPTSNDTTHRWRNRWNATVEGWGFRRAAAVIAVSESLFDYGALQGIPRQRLHVVPNGVPATAVLAHRPTPAVTWTLGCVALFRPRKGLEILLDALALLRRHGHDVSLRAVGSFETPEYQRAILDQVQRLDLAEHICWTGFSADVPGEMARMDLFALPSLFGEGMPMVILEAMAAGVPVVASRVEGIPQVIRNGIDGLLADAGDPHDLAWQISRVIRGDVDWQELRILAHERQARHFSDRSMAQATAAIYDQVLGIEA